MKFLLDTNVIVEILRGNYEVQQRTYGIGLQNCCISSLTMAELYAGAYKSGKPAAFDQLKVIEEMFPILPFKDSYRTFGRLRNETDGIGRHIDDIDLLIASIALDNDLVLATHNLKHFADIPGLELADSVF